MKKQRIQVPGAKVKAGDTVAVTIVGTASVDDYGDTYVNTADGTEVYLTEEDLGDKAISVAVFKGKGA